jgi:hypothetical protein
MSKPIPLGYSINIKNEPYISDICDSIITPTRLLVTIKYKNQIIERYYLSLGINASRENIIQSFNEQYIQ